ncbi:hypothetical protein [Methylophaga lonarensis]|uniref:hypothetical protein n=1 Tax=Methylophaga lonarensis TaxID=999151 RepID=UPI003D2D2AE1
MKKQIKQAVIAWLFRIAAWLSQGLNVILLGGHEDETVSARAYRSQNRLRWLIVYRALNFVFFWQFDHCRESHERDRRRAKELLIA